MDSKYELTVMRPESATSSNDSERPRTMAPVLLKFAQARQVYPCDGCSAPCCSYLPLHTFNVSHMRELDHALYLLNFPRIELGINATGGWGVYYRYPCRFLDRDSALCTIYQSELRPSICTHYNPYSCWYKQALIPNVHESFVRIDNAFQRLNFDVCHLASVSSCC